MSTSQKCDIVTLPKFNVRAIYICIPLISHTSSHAFLHISSHSLAKRAFAFPSHVSHETIIHTFTYICILTLIYLYILISAFSKFLMSMCPLENALAALRAFNNTNVYIFKHMYSRFYHAIKHSNLRMLTICIMNTRAYSAVCAFRVASRLAAPLAFPSLNGTHATLRPHWR